MQHSTRPLVCGLHVNTRLYHRPCPWLYAFRQISLNYYPQAILGLPLLLISPSNDRPILDLTKLSQPVFSHLLNWCTCWFIYDLMQYLHGQWPHIHLNIFILCTCWFLVPQHSTPYRHIALLDLLPFYRTFQHLWNFTITRHLYETRHFDHPALICVYILFTISLFMQYWSKFKKRHPYCATLAQTYSQCLHLFFLKCIAPT